ncbi:CBS domain-containing protein [Buchnera aphidicola]|uniref:CBS domain-containing protein n=1 Tax=Buchnera aphidicola TaxID=9 RepID=UPI00223849B1|nr:CBS domain-containing protein [Buchnera aphidicola]MCW5197546.1 CBS domain-containing protein [Buchnera aphidicola (Chaitophorus viminalis)]
MYKKKGFISKFLNKVFSETPENKKELLYFINKSIKNKLITQNTYNTIEKVINLENKQVKDIMIPRTKMITLNIHDTLNKCLQIIVKSSYSRFPIISYDKNHIIGFLIAKNLFKIVYENNKNFSLKEIITKPAIVPDSQNLNRTLEEFYINKNYISIVIDEFGIITGLITIKDILKNLFKKNKKKKKIF